MQNEPQHVSTEPGSPAINRSNLLAKLCFVRFRHSLADFGPRLEIDLIRFLQSEGDSPVSRQTIVNWFRKNPSRPSRLAALSFLGRYLRQGVNYESLDDDQKKVHSQILRYLNNAVPSAPTEVSGATQRITMLGPDRLALDVHGTSAALTRLSSIEGLYIAYHARLTEDHKGMFTQEVLRIARKGRELQFDLWYLKEGTHIEKYNGRIFVFGNFAWFIGTTLKLPDRMRVMTFRDIHSQSRRYTDVRCGLMLADIPSPSSPEPVACRIAIVRMKRDVDDIGRFAREVVRNFRPGDAILFPDKPIIRLIDNRITAHSATHSFVPERSPDGEELADGVLKVDQATTERVAEALLGDLETKGQ